MFNNVGAKCKVLAKAVCYIGIIASIICGLSMIIAGAQSSTEVSTLYLIIGIVIILFGSLLSWLGSLSLYAIGEAAENSAIAANLAVKEDMEREKEGKGE